MYKHKDAEYKEYIAKFHIEEGWRATDLSYELSVSATSPAMDKRIPRKAETAGQSYR